MNLYGYTGNNPINWYDFTGLDFTNTGSHTIWVYKDGVWISVGPGQTEQGETDAAVAVPEKQDEANECSDKPKCKAYKWIDCYDASGSADTKGNLTIKLIYCGQNHAGNKSRLRKAVCSTSASAWLAQKIRGGWKDPVKEFGSAPPGCEQ